MGSSYESIILIRHVSGISTLRSQNAKELLKLGEIDLLTDILASTSCLITIVEVDDLGEAFKIIDMVNEFPVSKKHLVVIVPKLDFGI